MKVPEPPKLHKKDESLLHKNSFSKEDLIKWARETKTDIHMGELMSICSIKHFETPSKRKYKGRIVFRGDFVRDQFNAAAVFQDQKNQRNNQ